jgi:hypothetical protein
MSVHLNGVDRENSIFLSLLAWRWHWYLGACVPESFHGRMNSYTHYFVWPYDPLWWGCCTWSPLLLMGKIQTILMIKNTVRKVTTVQVLQQCLNVSVVPSRVISLSIEWAHTSISCRFYFIRLCEFLNVTNKLLFSLSATEELFTLFLCKFTTMTWTLKLISAEE